MTKTAPFDPYALIEALDRERVSYVVVGGFARVVHGSAETTRGLDIVPALREDNLRRLARAVDGIKVGAKGRASMDVDRLTDADVLAVRTRGGELKVIGAPWGTRGYQELRIRSSRDNLGRGARPAIASVVDCARMLEASPRPRDADRLLRLRRMMELERQRVRRRGLTLER
jgi:hypothetical protein